jgi:hypothetical protein
VLYGVLAPLPFELSSTHLTFTRSLYTKRRAHRLLEHRTTQPALRMCPLPRLTTLQAGLTVHVYDAQSCVSQVVTLQGRTLLRVAEGLGVSPREMHDLTSLGRRILDVSGEILHITRLPFGGGPPPLSGGESRLGESKLGGGEGSQKKNQSSRSDKGGEKAKGKDKENEEKERQERRRGVVSPLLAAVSVELRLPPPAPLEVSFVPVDPDPNPPSPTTAPAPIVGRTVQRTGRGSYVVGSGRSSQLGRARAFLAKRERELQELALRPSTAESATSQSTAASETFESTTMPPVVETEAGAEGV